MNTLLLSLAGYTELTARVAGLCPAARQIQFLEKAAFPDGETYHRLPAVAGQHLVLLGGTSTDAAFMEMVDVAYTAVLNSVQKLTLIIPYFGYSTMERETVEGEAVKAKIRAVQISTLPRPPLGLAVYLVDLHAAGIPYYFEGGLIAKHLYANQVLQGAIKAYAGDVPFCLAGADSGRAKWLQSYANDLGVKASYPIKERKSGSETRLVALGLAEDFDPKTIVFLYDDMIRTGGSMIDAARAYRERGAHRIVAVATHAILPGDSLGRLVRSGQIEALLVTDSHPRASLLAAEQPEFIQLHTLAPLLARHIQA
jgi:ribose-phosphate pyrophosphokinase